MKQPLEALEIRRLMAMFTVANANDAGTGSLRWALDQANATTAADTITFAIGSGATTINLQSSLNVTQPLTIDATTQPGYAGVPLIRLNDANNVGTGLALNAPNTTVRGLSITGFGGPASSSDGTGVYVGKSYAVVEKCYIGLRRTAAQRRTRPRACISVWAVRPP
ncbi:MAG: hypothetical protein QM770_12130 [Tepidisphaeraceae bacterium]